MGKLAGKMGRVPGKIRNAATQMYADSHFSADDITRLSMTEHNNEPMARIYARIMSDTSIRQEETKRPGRFDLVYEADGREAIVGWIDNVRGMGEISQQAYDHVQDLSSDGCYVIRKGNDYAVRAYTDELGPDGKYVVLDENNAENGVAFSDDKFTTFASYEHAATAARAASRELGLAPSYDEQYESIPEALEEAGAFDYSDEAERANDVPSARGFVQDRGQHTGAEDDGRWENLAESLSDVYPPIDEEERDEADFNPDRDNGSAAHDMPGHSDENGFFHPDDSDFGMGE